VQKVAGCLDAFMKKSPKKSPKTFFNANLHRIAKMLATFFYKLSKVNTHTMGENSPNQVTLVGR
jgi:hypothetical protein